MWRILCLCVATLIPVAASATIFSAGLDNSRWDTEGDIFECRLKHPIPGYGAAEFVTRAGEQASFLLTSWQRPMQKGLARVVQQPPHWDQLSRSHPLGEIKVRAGRQPVRLAGPIPTQMLSALRDGQGAAIQRLAWFDSNETIDVRLSTVNFQQAYRGYMDCLATLLPVNFDQIRRTALYFDTSKEVLSEENTEILDSIALYIKADPEIAQIVIDGHTDDIGRRLKNRELSRERAAEVRDYLTSFGIDESMMLVRFHGERYPVVKNNSAANRALNRRVTLQLKKKFEVERDARKAERRARQLEQAIDAVDPDTGTLAPSATLSPEATPAQPASAPQVQTDPAEDAGTPFAPPQNAALPAQARAEPGRATEPGAASDAAPSALSPAAGLDQALPNSGLDSDLPNSGLDTGLPAATAP